MAGTGHWDIGLWTVSWYIAERNGPQFRIESWEHGATLPSLLYYSAADWSEMPKRRILIVDNNDELRAILEDALGSLGHEAVVTGDRAEALSRKDLDRV